MSIRVVALLALISLSSSCSHEPRDINRAEQLAESGNFEAAVEALREKYEQDPESTMYKGALIRITNISLAVLGRQADLALKQERISEAEELYLRALAIDGQSRRAQNGLRRIEQAKRQNDWLERAKTALKNRDNGEALYYVRKVLAENPEHILAQQFFVKMRAATQEARQEPQLELNPSQGISLELRDTELKDALILISQSAKINFILDQDLPANIPVTLFVNDARIEDVIEFILQTYALEKKILNPKTILIYPATPEKKARYADLYTRAFYISHSKPDTVADVLRSLLKPNELHVDDAARSLTIRDTAEVLEAAERLIELHDTPSPEVLLDVEILEVSSDALSNLGVDYPNKFSLSVKGQDGKAGALRLSELDDLNGDSFTLGVGDPLAVLNFKNTLGSGNILAKPQIRVKNREQANILIGDKVPVITSTLNQTSGFESQSVTYLDVGIKLDVQPEIFPGNEVSMKVLLEVSNIAKEIVGDSGLLAYQIGTRTANTTLQLRDGETQILAGLIKNEDINSKSRVPGLSAIPGLGRLFVNENNTHKKSELVLLITPRIVRNIQRPDAYASEFYSGTKDRFSLSLPAIGPQARYSRESLSDPVADENQRSEISSSASEEIISSATASKITSQAPQLNLSAPRSIDGGQTFSTTIALDAAVKAETNFLLSYEAAALELLSITPLTQRAELKYTNNPGQIDFTLTSTNFARESDILATVSFKAKSTDTERTTTLELNSASDEKLAAPPLNGISHQLQITPVVLDVPGSTDNAIDASAVNP